MRRFALASAILSVMLVSIAGCKQHNDPLIKPKDQALMDRAIKKGRETQAQFVAALAAGKASFHGYSIKKGFPTPSGGMEFMWIAPVTWDGKQFSGIINNDAEETKVVKLGDHVTVTPEQVADWMYIDGNDLIGGYTVRVLHYESSPEEQAEFTKNTGMNVPPIDF